jgi:hypothetical protein
VQPAPLAIEDGEAIHEMKQARLALENAAEAGKTKAEEKAWFSIMMDEELPEGLADKLAKDLLARAKRDALPSSVVRAAAKQVIQKDLKAITTQVAEHFCSGTMDEEDAEVVREDLADYKPVQMRVARHIAGKYERSELKDEQVEAVYDHLTAHPKVVEKVAEGVAEDFENDILSHVIDRAIIEKVAELLIPKFEANELNMDHHRAIVESMVATMRRIHTNMNTNMNTNTNTNMNTFPIPIPLPSSSSAGSMSTSTDTNTELE